MARRRRGRPVHGWVNLDKPAGIGSTRAVSIVRRAFDAQKAGHAGTLDPLASGVLPVALGEATKTVSFVMDGRKSYRFTVRWGEARDTDDSEGAVVAICGRRPTEAEIERALPAFVGEIAQAPPAFSAVRVDGERAYRLARAGTPVEPAARPVVIDRLALVETVDAERAVFEMDCRKGAYVRSLARDLAVALGTVGHVSALRRTRNGPFRDCDAIPLEKLPEPRHMGAQDGGAPGVSAVGDVSAIECAVLLQPVAKALDDIPALDVTESEAARIRNGQPVPVLRTGNRRRIDGLPDNAALCALLNGEAIALMRLSGRSAQPVRVFNL
ncbi:MAG: tRNA pseudouridine(55) synthase TruB [Rhodospirillaceae bacterium]|nr:tRNA pseudouridine(55) synthase TruB [Rhodospirillaceae bacterium]MYB13735.1 tRNA pseudouridine(55) synthase TruB [Rhodospirillaceae bacterium]MYI47777.1 tRNA pseudouridine(55) synthase TruB [Rhodospirillaceae bacterium]